MTKQIILGAAVLLVTAMWNGVTFAECGKVPATLTLCKTCHTLEAGKPSRATGPSLVGVIDRKAGEMADFKGYSEAMKAAREKGLTWTEDNIFNYLADPKGFLNTYNGQELKNAMAFQLKDEAKRKAAIEGLKEVAACQ